MSRQGAKNYTYEIKSGFHRCSAIAFFMGLTEAFVFVMKTNYLF